ncbi:hypothetical protein BCR43DRAFT_502553 [Syncephalastrum racemosum]|uniref:Uncharacterized protein n=1 Tax=Syncephalastrum racemosum TaxID=13706 RepID=A0A1X2HNH4_SYNRA|nr:hypothetical protein BCR43DRAFT_502553 [Syncephalastrum racemosum]
MTEERVRTLSVSEVLACASRHFWDKVAPCHQSRHLEDRPGVSGAGQKTKTTGEERGSPLQEIHLLFACDPWLRSSLSAHILTKSIKLQTVLWSLLTDPQQLPQPDICEDGSSNPIVGLQRSEQEIDNKLRAPGCRRRNADGLAPISEESMPRAMPAWPYISESIHQAL